MKIIKKQGKSKQQLVQQFMLQHGIKNEHEVRLEVLDEGSRGFLGLFGTRPACVNFFLDEPEDRVKAFLENLLERFEEAKATVLVRKKTDTLEVEIRGVKDAGFMIGREGRFLNSLQHLLNRLLDGKNEASLRVQLDIDNWRARHEQQITDKVEALCHKVTERGRRITLEPMSSRDRRLVHQLVEKHTDLRTQTIGNGELKRIMIITASEQQQRFNRNKNNNSGQRSRPPRRPNRDDRFKNDSNHSERRASFDRRSKDEQDDNPNNRSRRYSNPRRRYNPGRDKRNDHPAN